MNFVKLFMVIMVSVAFSNDTIHCTNSQQSNIANQVATVQADQIKVEDQAATAQATQANVQGEINSAQAFKATTQTDQTNVQNKISSAQTAHANRADLQAQRVTNQAARATMKNSAQTDRAQVASDFNAAVQAEASKIKAAVKTQVSDKKKAAQTQAKSDAQNRYDTAEYEKQEVENNPDAQADFEASQYYYNLQDLKASQGTYDKSDYMASTGKYEITDNAKTFGDTHDIHPLVTHETFFTDVAAQKCMGSGKACVGTTYNSQGTCCVNYQCESSPYILATPGESGMCFDDTASCGATNAFCAGGGSSDSQGSCCGGDICGMGSYEEPASATQWGTCYLVPPPPSSTSSTCGLEKCECQCCGVVCGPCCEYGSGDGCSCNPPPCDSEDCICGSNSDCSSGNCYAGLCQACVGEGAFCSNDGECCDSDCSGGICGGIESWATAYVEADMAINIYLIDTLSFGEIDYCIMNGARCEVTSDCCSGLICDGNVCVSNAEEASWVAPIEDTAVMIGATAVAILTGQEGAEITGLAGVAADVGATVAISADTIDAVSLGLITAEDITVGGLVGGTLLAGTAAYMGDMAYEVAEDPTLEGIIMLCVMTAMMVCPIAYAAYAADAVATAAAAAEVADASEATALAAESAAAETAAATGEVGVAATGEVDVAAAATGAVESGAAESAAAATDTTVAIDAQAAVAGAAATEVADASIVATADAADADAAVATADENVATAESDAVKARTTADAVKARTTAAADKLTADAAAAKASESLSEKMTALVGENMTTALTMTGYVLMAGMGVYMEYALLEAFEHSFTSGLIFIAEILGMVVGMEWAMEYYAVDEVEVTEEAKAASKDINSSKDVKTSATKVTETSETLKAARTNEKSANDALKSDKANKSSTQDDINVKSASKATARAKTNFDIAASRFKKAVDADKQAAKADVSAEAKPSTTDTTTAGAEDTASKKAVNEEFAKTPEGQVATEAVTSAKAELKAADESLSKAQAAETGAKAKVETTKQALENYGNYKEVQTKLKEYNEAKAATAKVREVESKKGFKSSEKSDNVKNAENAELNAKKAYELEVETSPYDDLETEYKNAQNEYKEATETKYEKMKKAINADAAKNAAVKNLEDQGLQKALDDHLNNSRLEAKKYDLTNKAKMSKPTIVRDGNEVKYTFQAVERESYKPSKPEVEINESGKSQLNQNGLLTQPTEAYEYDLKTNKTFKSTKTDEYTQTKITKMKSTIREYDEKDKLIKSTTNEYDQTGNVIKTTTREYDPSTGKEIRMYNSDATIEVRINLKSGQKTEAILQDKFDKEGKIVKSTANKYNAEGDRITESTVKEYTYDKNGKLIKTTTSKSNLLDSGELSEPVVTDDWLSSYAHLKDSINNLSDRINVTRDQFNAWYDEITETDSLITRTAKYISKLFKSSDEVETRSDEQLLTDIENNYTDAATELEIALRSNDPIRIQTAQRTFDESLSAYRAIAENTGEVSVDNLPGDGSSVRDEVATNENLQAAKPETIDVSPEQARVDNAINNIEGSGENTGRLERVDSNVTVESQNAAEIAFDSLSDEDKAKLVQGKSIDNAAYNSAVEEVNALPERADELKLGDIRDTNPEADRAAHLNRLEAGRISLNSRIRSTESGRGMRGYTADTFKGWDYEGEAANGAEAHAASMSDSQVTADAAVEKLNPADGISINEGSDVGIEEKNKALNAGKKPTTIETRDLNNKLLESTTTKYDETTGEPVEYRTLKWNEKTKKYDYSVKKAGQPDDAETAANDEARLVDSAAKTTQEAESILIKFKKQFESLWEQIKNYFGFYSDEYIQKAFDDYLSSDLTKEEGQRYLLDESGVIETTEPRMVRDGNTMKYTFKVTDRGAVNGDKFGTTFEVKINLDSGIRTESIKKSSMGEEIFKYDSNGDSVEKMTKNTQGNIQHQIKNPATGQWIASEIDPWANLSEGDDSALMDSNKVKVETAGDAINAASKEISSAQKLLNTVLDLVRSVYKAAKWIYESIYGDKDWQDFTYWRSKWKDNEFFYKYHRDDQDFINQQKNDNEEFYNVINKIQDTNAARTLEAEKEYNKALEARDTAREELNNADANNLVAKNEKEASLKKAQDDVKASEKAYNKAISKKNMFKRELGYDGISKWHNDFDATKEGELARENTLKNQALTKSSVGKETVDNSAIKTGKTQQAKVKKTVRFNDQVEKTDSTGVKTTEQLDGEKKPVTGGASQEMSLSDLESAANNEVKLEDDELDPDFGGDRASETSSERSSEESILGGVRYSDEYFRNMNDSSANFGHDETRQVGAARANAQPRAGEEYTPSLYDTTRANAAKVSDAIRAQYDSARANISRGYDVVTGKDQALSRAALAEERNASAAEQSMNEDIGAREAQGGSGTAQVQKDYFAPRNLKENIKINEGEEHPGEWVARTAEESTTEVGADDGTATEDSELPVSEEDAAAEKWGKIWAKKREALEQKKRAEAEAAQPAQAAKIAASKQGEGELYLRMLNDNGSAESEQYFNEIENRQSEATRPQPKSNTVAEVESKKYLLPDDEAKTQDRIAQMNKNYNAKMDEELNVARAKTSVLKAKDVLDKRSKALENAQKDLLEDSENQSLKAKVAKMKTSVEAAEKRVALEDKNLEATNAKALEFKTKNDLEVTQAKYKTADEAYKKAITSKKSSWAQSEQEQATDVFAENWDDAPKEKTEREVAVEQEQALADQKNEDYRARQKAQKAYDKAKADSENKSKAYDDARKKYVQETVNERFYRNHGLGSYTGKPEDVSLKTAGSDAKPADITAKTSAAEGDNFINSATAAIKDASDFLEGVWNSIIKVLQPAIDYFFEMYHFMLGDEEEVAAAAKAAKEAKAENVMTETSTSSDPEVIAAREKVISAQNKLAEVKVSEKNALDYSTKKTGLTDANAISKYYDDASLKYSKAKTATAQAEQVLADSQDNLERVFQESVKRKVVKESSRVESEDIEHEEAQAPTKQEKVSGQEFAKTKEEKLADQSKVQEARMKQAQEATQARMQEFEASQAQIKERLEAAREEAAAQREAVEYGLNERVSETKPQLASGINANFQDYKSYDEMLAEAEGLISRSSESSVDDEPVVDRSNSLDEATVGIARNAEENTIRGGNKSETRLDRSEETTKTEDVARENYNKAVDTRRGLEKRIKHYEDIAGKKYKELYGSKTQEDQVFNKFSDAVDKMNEVNKSRVEVAEKSVIKAKNARVKAEADLKTAQDSVDATAIDKADKSLTTAKSNEDLALQSYNDALEIPRRFEKSLRDQLGVAEKSGVWSDDQITSLKDKLDTANKTAQKNEIESSSIADHRVAVATKNLNDAEDILKNRQKNLKVGVATEEDVTEAQQAVSKADWELQKAGGLKVKSNSKGLFAKMSDEVKGVSGEAEAAVKNASELKPLKGIRKTSEITLKTTSDYIADVQKWIDGVYEPACDFYDAMTEYDVRADYNDGARTREWFEKEMNSKRWNNDEGFKEHGNGAFQQFSDAVDKMNEANESRVNAAKADLDAKVVKTTDATKIDKNSSTTLKDAQDDQAAALKTYNKAIKSARRFADDLNKEYKAAEKSKIWTSDQIDALKLRRTKADITAFGKSEIYNDPASAKYIESERADLNEGQKTAYDEMNQAAEDVKNKEKKYKFQKKSNKKIERASKKIAKDLKDDPESNELQKADKEYNNKLKRSKQALRSSEKNLNAAESVRDQAIENFKNTLSHEQRAAYDEMNEAAEQADAQEKILNKELAKMKSVNDQAVEQFGRHLKADDTTRKITNQNKKITAAENSYEKAEDLFYEKQDAWRATLKKPTEQAAKQLNQAEQFAIEDNVIFNGVEPDITYDGQNTKYSFEVINEDGTTFEVTFDKNGERIKEEDKLGIDGVCRAV